MAFDPNSAYSVVVTNEGNKYYLQGGLYYWNAAPYQQVTEDLTGPAPGASSSSSFSALAGSATDNTSLAAALRTAIRTYTAPTPETAFTAETAVTSPTLDWTNTFITDANGTKMSWAGNGVESIVTMSDGTKFFRYADGSGNDKLMRSPTGGDTGSGQAWTTVDTQSGALDYTVILRDAATDTLLYFVGVGSSFNWTLRCKAFNSAGTQLGSTYDLPQSSGFLEGLSTNPYIRASCGPNGRFALVQPAQYWSGQSMQRTQTLYLNRMILTGTFSTATNTFTFDAVFRQFMPERTAYDIPFVGLNGDPDHICGICGRDVRNDEDVDYVTGLNGTLSGVYNFDQIGYWYYNRRTHENGFWWVTPKLGFLNAVNQARVTYVNGTTQATIHEVTKGTIRVGQSITNLSNVTGGITNGTTISSWASGTGAAGSVANISTTTGATAVTSPASVLCSFTDPQPPTTQKRYYQAIQTNDGYIMFAYINVRHSNGASGTAIAGNNSLRICKLTALGDLVYDEELLHEASGYGQNYHALWQNASSNQVYVIRLCNQGGASSAAADFSALKLKENTSFSANITTNGTTTVTVNSVSSGDLYPGSRIVGGTLAANTRVTKWGTFNPATGTGTIFVDQTPGSSTAAVTGWARAACENPIAANSLYSQWGTARAPNFVPFIPDNRSGSKVGTNVAEMFIPRRANDFPTNTSSTTTDKVDHAHVRLPA
jgi:hypothetical protein